MPARRFRHAGVAVERRAPFPRLPRAGVVLPLLIVSYYRPLRFRPLSCLQVEKPKDGNSLSVCLEHAMQTFPVDIAWVD